MQNNRATVRTLLCDIKVCKQSGGASTNFAVHR